MIDINDRLLLKHRPSDFRVLVLHRVVLLLFLSHCCGGQSSSIKKTGVLVGEDAILPCYLEPAVNAVGLTVEWTKPGRFTENVHLRKGGEDDFETQDPIYRDRTLMYTSKLQRGDVSLELLKAKFHDAGTYRCLVSSVGKDTEVELIVGSASQPYASVYKEEGGVLFHCRSDGWYPKPEVLLLDAEDNLLSSGPTESFIGPDDRYSVISKVTVKINHGTNFTCRVQQRDINQIREIRINVPDDFFIVPSNNSIEIIIAVVFSVFGVLVVIVAVVCIIQKIKARRNKTEAEATKNRTSGNSTELQHLSRS